ncbi:hypothetical protein [Methanoculleus chikugoensis]|uniref:hypothetical protein n=1 Tax=Methanoculleus chikugoensis TaxID=118126 RepID=UPI000A6E08DD|nr:hypothetical protein [Methanoculleus chikugoensis]
MQPPILIQGLKRLEYRGGYDSFGIATVGSAIEVYKKTGRISDGEAGAAHLTGSTGIGHTRWATHGEPNDLNAHPHTDCSGRIAVVHNGGVIENYGELKRQLEERGHTFRSETDTEVIAHLIEEHYDGDLLAAVNATLPPAPGGLVCRPRDRGGYAANRRRPRREPARLASGMPRSSPPRT